jgi:lipoprotein signal peptidase
MRGKWGLTMIPALVVVVLDQLTKAMIVARMELHQSISIIDGFFALTYVRTTGAAFGIFAGQRTFASRSARVAGGAGRPALVRATIRRRWP